jgi:uncharacterized protein with PQ loop repeat
MDITALLVNVIGFIATVFAIFMWVPQARITWQNRNDAVKLAGVSETTQWLSAASYLLWGVFGVLSESFWVMAPSLISFPLSIATIIVVRRGRLLPPLTKSTSIISTMTESLSVITTTGSVPIVATGTVPIAGASGPGSSTATGAIPILLSPYSEAFTGSTS